MVELRFLRPDVRRMDAANVELGACTIWSDSRPLRGFAGLLDWRLGGRLSALLKAGYMRGNVGEALLVPGRPHVPFEKVFLLGLGPRLAFSDAIFQDATARIKQSLEGLRVRRAVVELPGRGDGAIDPEHAISLALDVLGTSSEHDAWWLVEDAASQQRIEQRASEERRRVRTG